MTILLFLTAVFNILFVNVSYAAADNLYNFNWLDDGEVVYVIQNKEFPKAGRLGFDLHLIDGENVAYTDVGGFGAQLVYYFNEDWGIDLIYKKYSNDNNQDLNSLIGDLNTKPLVHRVESAILAHIDWIPFYGKINTFNRIFYFDWGFGVGAGKLDILTNHDTFNQKNIPLTFKPESVTGFDIRSFFRFYAHKNFNFGLEYDLTFFDTVVDAAGTKDRVVVNDILFTIGFMAL